GTDQTSTEDVSEETAAAAEGDSGTDQASTEDVSEETATAAETGTDSSENQSAAENTSEGTSESAADTGTDAASETEEEAADTESGSVLGVNVETYEELAEMVPLMEATQTEEWYLSHGYVLELVCGMEEHIHTVDCLSDDEADVETASDWEATLPGLTGNRAFDVVAVAQSQLGYTESVRNFILDEDGVTWRGYTRYGAWYGNEYGSWDAMFAAFCLHYAGVEEEEFPVNSGAYAWAVQLKELGAYAEAAEYDPVAGDLVFFDTDSDEKIDHVGIASVVDESSETLAVIEGDYTADEADSVCNNTYALDDSMIVGYGILPALEETTNAAKTASASEADKDADTSDTGLDEDAGLEDEADAESDETIIEEENILSTLEFYGTDYVITATYGEDAELPEGTTLQAYEYSQDSETYLARYAEAAELYGWSEEDDYTGLIRLFNIGFYDSSGVEIEPAAEVQVTITYLEEETESEDYTVTHFGESGTETIEPETVYGDGMQTITFEMDSFSDIMVTAGPGGGGSGGGGSGGGGSGGGGSGGGGDFGGGDSDEEPSTIYVWYDRVTVDGTTLTGQNDSDGIAGVTLDGSAVPHGDAESDYQNSTDGLVIDDPYSTSGQTVAITVTPETGYYITFISINCCGGAGAATSCDTYSDGGAYTSSFTVSETGAITINVTLDAENGFHHDSEATNYFILIGVAPIPSPLYVEYDHGDIVTLIGDSTADSAFSTADGWTTVSNGNYYGDGYSDSNGDGDIGVKTAYTQYKYAYTSGSTSEAANWTHYANTVTDEAKAQAIAAGYAFAGWKAEYYTSVTVTSQTASVGGYQDAYNNWEYEFSDSYGTSYYDEGDNVTLTTNVRLIAQWVPIGVTVQKIVTGLDGTEFEDTSREYTIEVQQLTGTDENGNETWETVKTVTLSVTVDGSASETIYPLSAGTYRVVETGGNDTLTSSDGSTTCYIGVSTTGEVTISSTSYDDYTETIVDSTTVLLAGTMTVTNTYDDEPVVVDVILKKVDDNGNILSDAVFTLTDSSGNTTIYTTGSDGTATMEDMRIASSYTLTETQAPDGYSLVSGDIPFTVNSAGVTFNTTVNEDVITTYVDSGGDIIIEVVNTVGAEMPSTGGIGTTIFYIVGGILVVGAVVLLITRRRMKNSK
ncbi:MAG: CHAP domain-containing protein, partial [Lachnospiraceae bacterium]|nr:CHAP domain-containing protein [Lachnospiraceae bacterium]